MCFVFMTLVSCRSERIPLLMLVPVDEFRVGGGPLCPLARIDN
jgi:hypothetical protein